MAPDLGSSGYYPTLVRDAVDRLIANSVIPPAISDEASKTDSEPEPQLEVPSLPVPHPLDYDWRFTKRTAGELLKKLLALTNSTDCVVLLGAPSIYVLAEKQRLADRLILLDRNNPLANSEVSSQSGGTAYCCDLMHLDLALLDSTTSRSRTPPLSSSATHYAPPDFSKWLQLGGAVICCPSERLLVPTSNGIL